MFVSMSSSFFVRYFQERKAVKNYLWVVAFFMIFSKPIFSSEFVECDIGFQSETEQFEDIDELEGLLDDAISRGITIKAKELTLFHRVMAPFADPLLWVYMKVVFSYRGIRDMLSMCYTSIEQYMPCAWFSCGEKNRAST